MRPIAIAATLALASAATLQAKEWSLQECIDHALDNNLTIQLRANDVTQSEIALTSALDAVLPTLSGNAGQNWSFGRSLNASNTYDNSNTSNLSLQAALNLPLFQGLQAVRQIKYQRIALDASKEQLLAAADDVTLQIMAQYLQCLYCREMEQVAQSQADLTATELLRRQALMDAGRIPEADMLDAKSQDAQARMQLVTAQNDTRLALLDLQQTLRLPYSETFGVQTLADPLPQSIPTPDDVYSAAKGINHTLRASQLQADAAAQQVKVAQTGWIPRLSLSAGLGTNYYHNAKMPNDPLGTQFRHNFAQQVGLSLNVPIFDAFQTRNSVRRARSQHLAQLINLETQDDNLFKSIQQAYYQAVGALERYNASNVAISASEAALAAVTEKYSVGRANPVDFDNAKNQYIRARSEATRAKYETDLRHRILLFYAQGK